jgi:hypothetical protein
LHRSMSRLIDTPAAYSLLDVRSDCKSYGD